MRDVDKIRKVVTRQRVIDWLESKPAATVVGFPLSSLYCPLANYVEAVTGKGVLIEPGATVSFGTEVAMLPKWCGKFVSWVDAFGTSDYERITKEECLKFFNDTNPNLR